MTNSSTPKSDLADASRGVEAKHRDARTYPRGVAFMDGQYLPISEAKISVLDWGFLHSDATYDTVHVWKDRFFRLDLHLDRFFAGMERLRLRIPYDRESVAGILNNCVAFSGHHSAYVEMICTRGFSPTFSRDPRDAENIFLAFAVPFSSVATPEQMKLGMSVAISDRVRIPPQSVDTRIKNYHWLDLVMGLFEGFDKGADTVILRDLRGNIAEGPGFNVFIVKNETLATPDTGVLPGITRQTILDICSESGISYSVEDISEDTLLTADEVFITSTAGGVMPVTRIAGREVGSGQIGPVTSRLTALYWTKHAEPSWSTEVQPTSRVSLA